MSFMWSEVDLWSWRLLESNFGLVVVGQRADICGWKIPCLSLEVGAIIILAFIILLPWFYRYMTLLKNYSVNPGLGILKTLIILVLLYGNCLTNDLKTTRYNWKTASSGLPWVLFENCLDSSSDILFEAPFLFFTSFYTINAMFFGSINSKYENVKVETSFQMASLIL